MQDDLTQKIIGCAYKVHNMLGMGFLEKVYENAMVIELTKQGISVKQQAPITVLYEGKIVGQFQADLWVANRVIVELKAVETLHKKHEVQLVNYLNASEVEIGLLLNFGSSMQIKRKYRHYKPKHR